MTDVLEKEGKVLNKEADELLVASRSGQESGAEILKKERDLRERLQRWKKKLIALHFEAMTNSMRRKGVTPVGGF